MPSLGKLDGTPKSVGGKLSTETGVRTLMSEFEALVIAHHPTVLRTAFRLLGQMEDAKDAAQEVFLKLLRNASKSPRDVGPWLYRVTVNVCNDYYRRRKPMTELSRNQTDASPDPECILRIRQTQNLMRQALGVLTGANVKLWSYATSKAFLPLKPL